MGFVSLNYLFAGDLASAFFTIMQFIIFEVIPSFIELILAPISNPEMMWIATPLLLALFLMQLYFARNKEEEGSWDNMFGNSVSLIFVCINLLQFLVTNSIFNNKLILVIIICIISVVQLIINYYHLISRKIAFLINSDITTNVTAYLIIIFVYSNIPLNVPTFVASILFFPILVYVFELIKSRIPKSLETKRFEKKIIQEQAHEKIISEKLNLRQEHLITARINDFLTAAIIIITTTIILNFLTIPLWIHSLIQSIIHLITFYLLMKRDKLKLSTINYDAQPSQWVAGIILGIPFFALITGLSLLISFFILFNPIITENFIIPSLITPIITELLFRGLLQRSLKSKFTQNHAIIIQALLFSLSCININYGITSLTFVPLIFLSGLLLGYTREKWGLESAISAHLTFNIIGLII